MIQIQGGVNMEIKDRILTVRKELGLTQKKFGERIGVAGNTITSYENGIRVPMEATIKAICREFNVSYDWLKYGTGDKIFDAVPETLVDELVQEFALDDLDQRIILGYLRLTEGERAAIKKYIQNVLDVQ